MIELLPAAGAALATGLLGGAHCLGMCAGISGIVAAGAAAETARRRVALTLAYNAGRLASYAILGAIVGLIGRTLVDRVPAFAGPLRMATGLVMVLIGLQVAFDLRLLRPIERAGASIWQRLSPLARHIVPVTTLPRAMALGLLWGWLPCGLVYSALLLATTTASAAGGALTMAVFGFGTLPAMLLTGLGAAQLAALTRRRGTRVGLGLLIVALGLLTMAMPVTGLLGTSHGHHG